jgi:hypothetical protein
MRLLSTTSRAALGAFSFTRLNGLSGARRAEDEKPKDDEKKGQRAADKDPEHYDDDGKGEHAEKGDDADGDDDKEKGDKSARRAEKDDEDENEARRAEDDDDDEEMKKAKAAGFGPLLAAQRHAACRAERARIGRIPSSAPAASRIASAAHVACNTGMSSAAAIALLETLPASPKAAGSALERAMSRVPQPQPGGDGGGAARATPGQSLLAAAKAHAVEIEEKKKARR